MRITWKRIPDFDEADLFVRFHSKNGTFERRLGGIRLGSDGYHWSPDSAWVEASGINIWDEREPCRGRSCREVKRVIEQRLFVHIVGSLDLGRPDHG